MKFTTLRNHFPSVEPARPHPWRTALVAVAILAGLVLVLRAMGVETTDQPTSDLFERNGSTWRLKSGN